MLILLVQNILHCESEKTCHSTFVHNWQMLTKFQNSFIIRIIKKFATKRW